MKDKTIMGIALFFSLEIFMALSGLVWSLFDKSVGWTIALCFINGCLIFAIGLITAVLLIVSIAMIPLWIAEKIKR